MSAPASVPPPRLPGLRKCSPVQYDWRLRTASWFRGFCKEHAISRRDLMCVWNKSRGIVDAIWEGRRPLPAELIKLLPPRHRDRASVEFLALQLESAA